MHTSLRNVFVFLICIMGFSMCKTAEKSVEEESRYYPSEEILYVMVRINQNGENISLVDAESNMKRPQHPGMQNDKVEKKENIVRCRLIDLQGKTLTEKIQNANFTFENEEGGKDAIVQFYITQLPNTSRAIVEFELLPGVWQEMYTAVL